jgi:hypothetical protein
VKQHRKHERPREVTVKSTELNWTTTATTTSNSGVRTLSSSHFLRNWLSLSFPFEMMPSSISDLLLLLLAFVFLWCPSFPLFMLHRRPRDTQNLRYISDTRSQERGVKNEDSHERLWGNFCCNRISLSNSLALLPFSYTFRKVVHENQKNK